MVTSPPWHDGDQSPLGSSIPAGYKAKTFFEAKLGAYELAVCELGAVSYWSGSTRYPQDLPDECLACTANTYAPRTGAWNVLRLQACACPRRARCCPVQLNLPFLRWRLYLSAGMSACLSCKGGSQTKKGTALLGNSVCEACDSGSFRSFYTLT